uniref:Uncharacterized protein n=1 Tax=Anopheles atroparvus TaxID=41427 RepID=A0A182IU83_ANOAO
MVTSVPSWMSSSAITLNAHGRLLLERQCVGRAEQRTAGEPVWTSSPWYSCSISCRLANMSLIVVGIDGLWHSLFVAAGRCICGAICCVRLLPMEVPRLRELQSSPRLTWETVGGDCGAIYKLVPTGTLRLKREAYPGVVHGVANRRCHGAPGFQTLVWFSVLWLRTLFLPAAATPFLLTSQPPQTPLPHPQTPQPQPPLPLLPLPLQSLLPRSPGPVAISVAAPSLCGGPAR